MSVEVYRDAEDYTIARDAEAGAVKFVWERAVSGAAFREGCEALLSVIEEQNARKILVDTRGIRAHDEADKQWLREDWVPRAADSRIEYIATVYPDCVIAELEREQFFSEASELAHAATVTDDMAEAREWLSGL